jgi:hypothetical protein
MSNFSYIRDAMGYKERSTWIELVVAAGVFLWYLTVIAGRVRGTPVADVAFQGPLIRATVISIVATIVLHILYAILAGSRDTQEDQRDRQVARYGDWVGLWPLVLGAGAALVLAMLEVDHFWVANAIYVGFVVSSLTNSVSRLLAYQRGLSLA